MVLTGLLFTILMLQCPQKPIALMMCVTLMQAWMSYVFVQLEVTHQSEHHAPVL